MALRWLEGFETRQREEWFDDLYASITGSSVAFVNGRKWGKAAQSSNYIWTTPTLVASPENTWIVCFGLKKSDDRTAVGANPTGGIELLTGGAHQCKLELRPSSRDGGFSLRLSRDTTAIDTATRDFAGGKWHYFMLKVTARTGVNGSYELKHYDFNNNGTTIFSGSGVNLAHQAVDGVDSVRLSIASGTSAAFAIDDIAILDSTGTKNNDFPTKPFVLQGMLPNGDGNQTDWITSSGSTHYTLVDESAITAGPDSGYVQSPTPGDIDLWTFSDLTNVLGGSTVIQGVHVVTTAAMRASGSQNVRVRVRHSTNEATGASFLVDGLDPGGFSTCFDQNPTGTPADWTKTTLEATEFGVEVV